MFPNILSKVFIGDLKALKTLEFSDWLFCLHSCTNKCTDFFLIAGNGGFRALTFVLFEDFISGLIAMNFLRLLNHKLISSKTFSGPFFSHEYRGIEIKKLCTHTESVQNGSKFPVAKWTELAL